MNDNVTATPRAAADSLLAKVARVQLTTGNFAGEVFGSTIFRVGPGWEAEQVKGERRVCAVTTATELREAMEDPDTVTLYIPHKAALTMEMVERILRLSSLDKTLFWETD